VFQHAQSEAAVHDIPYVVPAALLLALLKYTDAVDRVLSPSSGSKARLVDGAERALTGDDLARADVLGVIQVARLAVVIADGRGAREATPNDILAALLQTRPPSLSAILAATGVRIGQDDTGGEPTTPS
jgi:hypothetical protein